MRKVQSQNPQVSRSTSESNERNQSCYASNKAEKHFYLICGSQTNDRILRVGKILSEQLQYNKAIVYCENFHEVKAIFDLLQFYTLTRVRIVYSFHNQEQIKQRFQLFAKSRKVLITDLKPNQLFKTQEPKGVLAVGDVDLIINLNLPRTLPEYMDKCRKIGACRKMGTNKTLSVVSITNSYQNMENLVGSSLNMKQFTGLSKVSSLNSLTLVNAIMSKSLQKDIKTSRKIRNLKTIQFDRTSTSPYEDRRNTDDSYGHCNQLMFNANKEALKEKKYEENEQESLLTWVRKNVIGLNTKFTSCLKLQLQAVYVDHTATNRPFRMIEEMVEHAKLQAANPHTEFSHFGEFSTDLMKYSRDSLLRSFNSPKGQYTVLPTGAGSTGAIEKAVGFLKELETDKENGWANPKIYVTPYEHHSNILPWVEFYPLGSVEELAHDENLTIDFAKSKIQILSSQSECIILTVSAASNVTSKLTNMEKLNRMVFEIRKMETKKILLCVDCAAFCCHQQLDLRAFNQIDFAFLSPHKNLGGAESCGVLVARNSIIAREKPVFPGGGTVKFVKGYSPDDVMYEEDNFAREIAGTPPYLGFYRAALSFELLTNRIGYSFIHKQEVCNTKLFFRLVAEENERLRKECNSEIKFYGDRNPSERANVVSFNILSNGEMMKQNFVSRLLNDIFGIQVRSGCFCAGPHGIKLLQLKESIIHKIEDEVSGGIMINKPGYVRIDLTFYLEEFEIKYIVSAISIIAKYWKNSEIYDLKKNGEIQVSIATGYKSKFMYSLSEYTSIKQDLDNHNYCQERRLRSRKMTLENQLKKGELISKSPFTHMKIVKNGC